MLKIYNIHHGARMSCKMLAGYNDTAIIVKWLQPMIVIRYKSCKCCRKRSNGGTGWRSIG